MSSVRAAILSLSVPEERTVFSHRTSLVPFSFSRTIQEADKKGFLRPPLLVNISMPTLDDKYYGRLHHRKSFQTLGAVTAAAGIAKCEKATGVVSFQ